MTKFDWEKDPYAQIVRHQKSRQTQKDYLKKKAAKLIKKERELQKPYQSGINAGVKQERERIINLVERLDISFSAEEGHNFIVGDALDLIDLIKGEQK